jgi:hypothetical protein
MSALEQPDVLKGERHQNPYQNDRYIFGMATRFLRNFSFNAYHAFDIRAWHSQRASNDSFSAIRLRLEEARF